MVPAPNREEVFRALHQQGNHGYQATLRRITQRFWWPYVRAVSEFVKDCEVCDRDCFSNPAPRTPLEHLPADRPFAALYIDIVGNQGSLLLGASPKSIQTMIEKLTGWAKATPIPDQSAVKVACVIHSKWIVRYGVPKQIHSDNGVQFEAAIFTELFVARNRGKANDTVSSAR